MSNRLSRETSPYLQQHQNNPVDWYPWGEEALQRARSENKPILLSIGYSACHWCHVMEHESFENVDTARLMNENYINIKVDREERPDLDQIYQNVAQAMTMGGGWPLTVFLTPELKPFFGGTYFPPEDKYGRPGFPKVLQALSHAFKNDPQGVSENAEKLTEYIASNDSIATNDQRRPSRESFQKITDGILSRVDWEHGGFGHAPKFPNTMLLSFLWRYGMAADFPKAREAVRMSLTQMAYGGIYDQLGGGFHRYSVDQTWSVPHFEKMLYDNALLLKLYSEVLLTHPNELHQDEKKLYLRVLSETVGYVFREMTSKEGVFYSAQDADSEGEEGKFFVWDLADLSQVLTPEEARVIALRYGVTESGNFEHGKTVLYIAKEISKISEELGKPENEVEGLLENASQKLFKSRSQRIAPGLDNKVLTSWNGLMISGLAWTSQALRENGQKELADQVFRAAVRAFQFLKGNVSQSQNRLMSTYQGGKAKLNAYLDDYAFLAMAALDLSRFTQSDEEGKTYLADCEKWIEVVLKHFQDSSAAGFFFTSDDHEKLIQRPKTVFDQAIPSGTATALTCMAALSEIDLTENSKKYSDLVDHQLASLYGSAEKNSFGLGELLCASLLHHMGPVTVSGKSSENWCWHPFIFRKPDSELNHQQKLLICHQKTCSLPMDSAEKVEKMLFDHLRLKH